MPATAQTFSGHLEAKGFGYLERSVERDPWVEGFSTLFLKEEAHLGPLVLAVSARTEALTSPARGALVFDPADRQLRRSPLSLRDAWARLSVTRDLDLTLGRMELGWGKTDGYSPADAFLPRDLSDPYADEKLPLWGARAQAQRGHVRADLFVAATTTPWRLPVLSGRWAPVSVEGLPVPVYLVDGGGSVPRDGFGALRLLGTFGDWDVGLWGRAGVRPSPLLVPRLDLAELRADGVAIPVDRRFVRERAAGAEVSRVVSAFIVRGELAVSSSADPELGDALIWTLGLERAFGDGTLSTTLAGNARATAVDPALLLDRSLLPEFIGVWNRTERWGSWRVVWMAGLRHGDGLVKAEVADDLTDTLRLTLGADLPYGSREGTLGRQDAGRRVHAALRTSW